MTPNTMHVLATVVRSGGELKVFPWLCAQSSYLLQYLSPLVVFIVSVLLPVMLLAVRIMWPSLARKTIFGGPLALEKTYYG